MNKFNRQPDTMIFDPPPICAQFPSIGGGSSYDPDAFTTDTKYPSGPRITPDDADVVVTPSDDTIDVSSGTTLWYDTNHIFDGHGTIHVTGDNVTLASGGSDGSFGALLKTDQRIHPAIRIDGDDCRVTGLRLRGPEPDSFDTRGYDDDNNVATGISINGDRCEVDNCLIRGWTFAGIETGRKSYPEHCHLHHNTIVDNHAKELGYGIHVFQGHPHVTASYVDNNRHSIAGTGDDRCSWTLLDSIVGEHHRLHALDMHAGGDGRAGERVAVLRSLLLPTHNWYNAEGPSEYRQETLSLRGIPRNECHIRHNLWANREPQEPMRDSANNAINVHGAGSFAEAKLSGLETNRWSWVPVDSIDLDVGPVKDESVTGYSEPEPTPEEPSTELTTQDVYDAARRAAEDVLREGVDR